MAKLRCGIIGHAKIAIERLVPAIQKSRNVELVAFASRSHEKAEQFALAHNIPYVYDSYEALIESGRVDAIYNPLPNHLHYEYSVKALERGVHVLCEKPLTVDARQLQQLHDVCDAHPGVHVMEAFMYRFHPRWVRVREMVQEGIIGEPRAMQVFFSYKNYDPENIRNKYVEGGGGLLDIGCYGVSSTRFILGDEIEYVSGCLNIDESFSVDTFASFQLNYRNGVASSCMCATTLEPFQKVQIIGREGRIELDLPFNPPDFTSTKIHLFKNLEASTIEIEPADQYQYQVEAFADAVLHAKPTPLSLSDSLTNMRILDAIKESSARQGASVKV